MTLYFGHELCEKVFDNLVSSIVYRPELIVWVLAHTSILDPAVLTHPQLRHDLLGEKLT